MQLSCADSNDSDRFKPGAVRDMLIRLLDPGSCQKSWLQAKEPKEKSAKVVPSSMLHDQSPGSLDFSLSLNLAASSFLCPKLDGSTTHRRCGGDSSEGSIQVQTSFITFDGRFQNPEAYKKALQA